MSKPRHSFKRRSKYGAKRTEYNGRVYDSIKEAGYARRLDLLMETGEVLFWLPQVPIPLPGKTRYVVDFVIFNADGTCQFVDVKGVETEVFKLKKRQVESLYPIEVEVV